MSTRTDIRVVRSFRIDMFVGIVVVVGAGRIAHKDIIVFVVVELMVRPRDQEIHARVPLYLGSNPPGRKSGLSFCWWIQLTRNRKIVFSRNASLARAASASALALVLNQKKCVAVAIVGAVAGQGRNT